MPRWSFLALLITLAALALSLSPPAAEAHPVGYPGVYRGTERGANWADLNLHLPPIGAVLAIAGDPADPRTVYLGSDQGLLRSRDGGETWQALGPGPGATPVFAIAAPAQPAGLVYAAAADTLYRSQDGGERWEPAGALSPGGLTALWVDPGNSSRLLGGNGEGVLASDDGGRSWRDASAGLPRARVQDLVPDPSQPGRLWAGTAAGLFRREPGAAEWTAVANGLTAKIAYTVLFVPRRPGVVLAGTYDGLFLSRDGGQSWQPWVVPTFDQVAVLRLAASEQEPPSLFAATTERGILVGGLDTERWTRPDDGVMNNTGVAGAVVHLDPGDPTAVLSGTTFTPITAVWQKGAAPAPALRRAGASGTPAPNATAAGPTPVPAESPTRSRLPLDGLALLIAFWAGVAHAIQPGHGKTLVGAYLVGQRGRWRDAVVLGATTTLSHSASVIVLGLAAGAVSTALPRTLEPLLTLASGALILGTALWLLRGWWRRRRLPADSPFADEVHDHPHPHTHPHPHEHKPKSALKGSPRRLSWWALALLGISGGLVPSPDAVGVVLTAAREEQFLGGALVVLAFSLGLAAVLVGIGLLAVRASGLTRRWLNGRRWRLVEGLSLGLIAALGLIWLGLGLSQAVRTLG